MTVSDDQHPALTLLQQRRSVKPEFMTAPGPDAAQLEQLVAAALRVPDHGKIGPWRIVHVAPPAARRIGAQILERWQVLNPDVPPHRGAQEAHRLDKSPCCLMVVSAPDPDHKIPVWEQELSVGAVCQNLLIAAHAMGFVAQWLTGWIAYDPVVTGLLGVTGRERVAGFLHLGTAVEAAAERDRPDPASRFSTLED